jgi:hypothetical protein
MIALFQARRSKTSPAANLTLSRPFSRALRLLRGLDSSLVPLPFACAEDRFLSRSPTLIAHPDIVSRLPSTFPTAVLHRVPHTYGYHLIDPAPLCYQPRPRCAATTRLPLATCQRRCADEAHGGDRVDLRGLLLSIVMGLGFWTFILVSLSLLIQ